MLEWFYEIYARSVRVSLIIIFLLFVTWLVWDIGKISNNINYNIPKEYTNFIVVEIKYSTNVLSLYKVKYFQDDKKTIENSFTFVDSVKKYSVSDTLKMEIK